MINIINEVNKETKFDEIEKKIMESLLNNQKCVINSITTEEAKSIKSLRDSEKKLKNRPKIKIFKSNLNLS